MKSHKTIHCEPIHHHMLNSAQGQGQTYRSVTVTTHQQPHTNGSLISTENPFWRRRKITYGNWYHLPLLLYYIPIRSQQPLTDVPYLI